LLLFWLFNNLWQWDRKNEAKVDGRATCESRLIDKSGSEEGEE